ncbi:MAG TPA: PAS domain-containing protein [Aquabacterium sp.]|nr:PAS domain-containing protein [Aquabacterium sp.]HQC96310.1 PAS domain-containing protein [Aquabacterium sp.]
MRQNGPVTQREHVLPPGTTLVSTTDLQSRITYCNPAFVEVSGFERDALMGQPHNIVRHPDMPAEADRDLWATLKDGQPCGRPWSRTGARTATTTGCAPT